VPEVVPQEELPPTMALPEAFEVLDLRRLGDGPEPVSMFSGCEYEFRIKANLDERLLMYSACMDLPEGIGSNVTQRRLDAADVERIESAYARLQPSSEQQCATGAEIITLDLSIEGGSQPDASFADDEHSDCSLPYPEHVGFVSGLDELYSELLSLLNE